MFAFTCALASVQAYVLPFRLVYVRARTYSLNSLILEIDLFINAALK